MNNLKYFAIFLVVAFIMILFHAIVFAVGIFLWLFKIIVISGIIAFFIYGFMSLKNKLK